jgi:hypothetical protein
VSSLSISSQLYVNICFLVRLERQSTAGGKPIQPGLFFRLEEMKKIGTRRMEALKNSGAYQIEEAMKWVNTHRDQFQEEVFGPVLLEVH